MDGTVDETVARLRRGLPFRVVMPICDLTDFLSQTTALFGQLPPVAVRPAPGKPAKVHVDFSTADAGWELRSALPAVSQVQVVSIIPLPGLPSELGF
jgi:hypothetical protein